MAVIGEAWIKITPQTQAFASEVTKDVGAALGRAGQAGADAFRRAVSTMGTAIAETVQAGVRIATAAMAGFAAAVITAGASYNILGQSSMAAFETLLGSAAAAEQMMADIAEFGKTSPFPRQAFISGTQQLLGFGLEARKVIPTLDAVQQAVAATGGGAQEIEEIVYVLAQIQGTGKITAETLNMLGQRGINAAELIGAQMGKTGNEIRSEITKGTLDAGEALDSLVAGMQDRFGGAADNLKNTFAGATDRVKGAMRDIGSAIVEPFIGFTGGGVLTDFANTIADALRRIQSDVLPALMPMFETLAGRISEFGDSIAGMFDRLSESGISGLVENLSGLGPIIGAIGAALGTSFGGSLPIIGQFLSGLNPIVVGLGVLIASSSELREAFGDAFQAVAPVLAEVAGVAADVVGILGGALTPILEAVAVVVEGLAPFFGDLARLVGELASTVGSALMDALEVLMPSLSALVIAIGEGLRPVLPVITDALGAVAGILPVVAEAFAGIFDALAPLITPELVQSLLTLFSPWFLAIQVLEPLMPLLGELVMMLADLAAEVLTALAPALPPLVDAIQSVVEALAQGLLEVLVALMPALPPLALALADIALAIVPLIPPLAELAVLLIEKIGAPLLVRVAEVLVVVSEAVALIAVAVADVLAAGVGLLVDIFGGIADAFANFDPAAIQEFFMGLPGVIADALGNIGTAIGGAVSSAFSWVTQQLPRYAARFLAWWTSLPATIVRGLVRLGATIATAIGNAIIEVVSALPGLAADLIAWFVNLPFMLVAMLATLGVELVTAFAAGVGWLITELPGIAAGVISFFVGLPGQLVGALSSLGSSLVSLMGTVWTLAQQAVVTGVTNLVSFVASLPTRISNALVNLASTMTTIASNAMSSMVTGITTGVTNVVNALAKLPGMILGLLGKVKDAAVDLGGSIIDGIGDGLLNILGFVGDLGTAIKSAFQSVINGAIDLINRAIPDKLGWGRFSISIDPNPIPHINLARGGLIRAREGGTFARIAEAGWDELVLSTDPRHRDRNRQLLRSAGMDDLGATSAATTFVFSEGSFSITFAGEQPTPAEAIAVGQNVARGFEEVLAGRQIERTARAI